MNRLDVELDASTGKALQGGRPEDGRRKDKFSLGQHRQISISLGYGWMGTGEGKSILTVTNVHV